MWLQSAEEIHDEDGHSQGLPFYQDVCGWVSVLPSKGHPRATMKNMRLEKDISGFQVQKMTPCCRQMLPFVGNDE